MKPSRSYPPPPATTTWRSGDAGSYLAEHLPEESVGSQMQACALRLEREANLILGWFHEGKGAEDAQRLARAAASAREAAELLRGTGTVQKG